MEIIKTFNDLVVYTCIYGDGYTLPDTFQSNSVTYLCYTDHDNLDPNGWQIVRSSPMFIDDLVRSAREKKILPHKFVREFQRSVYIDPSVKITKNPIELWNFLMGGKKNAVFGALLHSFRETVLDEFDEVFKQELDSPYVIEEHLKSYVISNPDGLKLKPIWSGMIARQHLNSNCIDAMDEWFCYVMRYSRRDQLSLSAIIEKMPKHLINLVEADNFKTDFHIWPVKGYSRPNRYREFSVNSLIPHILQAERNNQKYLKAIAERDNFKADKTDLLKFVPFFKRSNINYTLRLIARFIKTIFITKKN